MLLINTREMECDIIITAHFCVTGHSLANGGQTGTDNDYWGQYVTLWDHGGDAGGVATGEYVWYMTSTAAQSFGPRRRSWDTKN